MTIRPGQTLLRGAAATAVVAIIAGTGPVAGASTHGRSLHLTRAWSSPIPTHVVNLPDQRRRVNGADESTNWSGYALDQTVTSASADWTVPSVVQASPTAFSSTWVGVDGYTNNDLIQTGTSSDSNGSYYAWWEILPAAETRIAEPVAPGDAISASVAQVAGTEWQIVLTDTTQGWRFAQDESYSGPHDSAEWIEEAPTIVTSGGSASVAPLADYGTVDFSAVDVDGASADLATDPAASSITLVTGGQPNSVPSAPTSTGNGFTTTWENPSATTSSGAPPAGSSSGGSGASTSPTTPAPTTVPSAPTSVRAHRSGGRGATVRWTGSSTRGLSRWVVRVYAGPRLLGSYRVPADWVGVRFGGLAVGERYSFAVAAADSAGLGRFSRSNVVLIP